MDMKPIAMLDVIVQVLQTKSLLVQNSNAYEIDDVGLFIWELCDGTHSVKEIADALIKEYNVEFENALADCSEFILEMRNKGLIQ